MLSLPRKVSLIVWSKRTEYVAYSSTSSPIVTS